jgi:glutathione peroxidase-family protein
VSPAGEIVARFSPMVEPDDPNLISAIEDELPR